MALTRRGLLVGGFALGVAQGAMPVRAGGAISVLADDHLKLVMPELAAAYAAEGGGTAEFIYGATGTLARRIRQGLAFDLFMAADPEATGRLAEAGVLPDAGFPFAETRLTFLAHRGSALARDLSLGSLAEAARNGEPFRLAVPDPVTNPLGAAALDVLERWSVERLLRPRLMFAETAATVVDLVAGKKADVGLTARPLMRTGERAALLKTLDVPQGWHRVQLQRVVLAAKAGDEALRFHDFLLDGQARSIFLRHGFGLPGVPG
jgi:molybdate transport system substrate-binding protein